MLQAPFPYFGGKSRAAGLLWERLGDVPNYVEPFFGSGAVLFGRPTAPKLETVNDLDGFIANFFRAIQHAPDEVAKWADNPVNENDLHACHIWLVNQRETFTRKLEADFEFYDAKVAGFWVWGICCWIGSGWCSGEGPWKIAEIDGTRQLVHLGNAGRGVNRKLVHLGDAGRGVNRKRECIQGWFSALSERLKDVRVCSGDWTRVTSDAVLEKQGLTGVLLDPPYADTADRTDNLYAKDSNDVAHEVRKWAIENGSNPQLRIALCGYDGEHQMPPEWECVWWKAKKGYAGQGNGDNENQKRERIWFSPACLNPRNQFDFSGVDQ